MLSVSQPPDPIWLDADLTRLAQVFANLLNNSEVMEPGGAIEIAASADDHDVTVAVRDRGIGMSSDLLPHVFDMFVQADRSLERAQGGLGIGLTLVQTLVQMHGGSVRAKSAGLGRGDPPPSVAEDERAVVARDGVIAEHEIVALGASDGERRPFSGRQSRRR